MSDNKVVKSIAQLNQDLDAPIPRSAVKEREGAGRRSFSYLSTDYVIARMNSVFGNLNWATETVANDCVFQGQVNGKHCVSYIARVKVEAQHIDENGRVLRTSHTGTGYGDGSDGSNLGKAHELAAKEAESDALKRACKNLGQSMGLALYDKDQTNVVEDSSSSRSDAPAPKASAPTPARQTATSDRPKAPASERPKLAEAGGQARELVNRQITALAKIVNSKGVKTFADMKAEMQAKYGTDDKAKLSDAQASELLASLQALAG